MTLFAVGALIVSLGRPGTQNSPCSCPVTERGFHVRCHSAALCSPTRWSHLYAHSQTGQPYTDILSDSSVPASFEPSFKAHPTRTSSPMPWEVTISSEVLQSAFFLLGPFQNEQLPESLRFLVSFHRSTMIFFPIMRVCKPPLVLHRTPP